MWCSPATILILAIVIVSGVRYQGSYYYYYYSSSSSSSAASPTLTTERVAASKSDRGSHVAAVAAVAVVAVVVAVAVTVVSVVAVIAAAAAVAVVVAVFLAFTVVAASSTHTRVIDSQTCSVTDDSVRRVCCCWAPRLVLPVSD